MKQNKVMAYTAPELEIIALSQEGALCGSFQTDDIAPGRSDWWPDED